MEADEGMMMEDAAAMEGMMEADSMAGAEGEMMAMAESGSADGGDDKGGCCGGNNVDIDITFSVNVVPAAAADAGADAGAAEEASESMAAEEAMTGGEMTETTTETTMTTMTTEGGEGGMSSESGSSTSTSTSTAVSTSSTSTATSYEWSGAPDFECTKVETSTVTTSEGVETVMPPVMSEATAQECCDADIQEACTASSVTDTLGL